MAKNKVFTIEESNAAGSGTGIFDTSGFQVTTIIIGMLIGIGSLLVLMFYWRKTK